MTIPELLSRPIEFQCMMINRLELDLDEIKCPGSQLCGGTLEYHMEVYNALCKSVGIEPRR